MKKKKMSLANLVSKCAHCYSLIERKTTCQLHVISSTAVPLIDFTFAIDGARKKFKRSFVIHQIELEGKNYFELPNCFHSFPIQNRDCSRLEREIRFF